ncbi:MAG TPA: hypothetical protein VFH88_02335 [Candidatus Krumholzibacteria bacterium]|nr:hypothetical protein [Candidatus Krumholzibacteria bacterium]
MLQRLFVFLLVFSVFLSTLNCGNDTPTTGASGNPDCGIAALDPFTCFYTDTLRFQSVIVGNSVSTSVEIVNDHISIDPLDQGGTSANVSISASTCGDFAWTTGSWIIEPNNSVLVNVVFHPKSTGVHRCVLRVSGCDYVAMVGVGVADDPNVPAFHPACSVTNASSYAALLSVAFDYRAGSGVKYERDSLFVVVPSGQKEALYMPRNYTFSPGQYSIRNVNVYASAAPGPSAEDWQLIFSQSYTSGVVKCFELTGSFDNPAWSEINCQLHGYCQ